MSSKIYRYCSNHFSIVPILMSLCYLFFIVFAFVEKYSIFWNQNYKFFDLDGIYMHLIGYLNGFI